MSIRATSETLAKCREAMQNVYGAFDDLDVEAAQRWVPPPMVEGHRGRYLWTDAFGVVNFITLFRETADEKYIWLAKRLVTTVHEILGRTRDGNSLLPGATDDEPLRGGLRIGKEDATGSDADGQYHHYLTIWMFALNRMSVALHDPSYNDLAISLAKAVHPRFMIDRASSRPRMFWKMSMDLSKPLVTSEGNLDPIDGYVVFKLLQQTSGDPAVLAQEISEYKKILDTKWRRYISDDPLDLGMTLWTAHWFDKEEEWSTALTEKAFNCLRELYDEGQDFETPARYRLAFREFGTCMGIRCHDVDSEWDRRASKITTFWEKEGVVPKPRKKLAIERLAPITLVMYASAILPGAFRNGYLGGQY